MGLTKPIEQNKLNFQGTFMYLKDIIRGGRGMKLSFSTRGWAGLSFDEMLSLADEIVVVAGGQIANRGTTEEIFPLILADTLGGCPVLSKEEKK